MNIIKTLTVAFGLAYFGFSLVLLKQLSEMTEVLIADINRVVKTLGLLHLVASVVVALLIIFLI